MFTNLQGPVAAGVAGQVCEGAQGGGHTAAVARDEVPDEEVRGQTLLNSGPFPGEMEYDVVQTGIDRDQHFDAGGAVSRLTDSFTLKLNASRSSDSPGWTKA